jgi:hypothetical protein
VEALPGDVPFLALRVAFACQYQHGRQGNRQCEQSYHVSHPVGATHFFTVMRIFPVFNRLVLLHLVALARAISWAFV